MKSMDRRLKHVEARSGINEQGQSLVIWTGVPGPADGPDGPGPACATIVSGRNTGLWLTRCEGEAEAVKVHGSEAPPALKRVEIERILQVSRRRAV